MGVDERSTWARLRHAFQARSYRAAIRLRHGIVNREGVQRRTVLWYLLLTLFAGLPNAIYGKNSHPKPPRSYDVRPEAQIPVAPLGYMPPGQYPAFYYHALVSLHFIDASHLLFVFNTKGLLVRDHNCSTSDSQRMVRAVVLALPSGRVERQVNWELYDLSDFLWSLGNGEFLLRRCSKLDIVGASLVARPFIETSGAIEEIMFSPDHSLVVTEAKPVSEPEVPATDSPATSEIEADFVRIHPLAVIARGRLPHPGTLPIVDQGILETLVAPHNRWIVNLNPFKGSQRKITTLESFCMPRLTQLSNQVFVGAICPTKGNRVFEGYDIDGTSLWSIPMPDDLHYPRFLSIRNGAEFAIESLHATQPLAALDPLSNAVIDAETIDIYDTRTGIHIGSFATTPVYTAGRNVAFSADGQRMAVLHNGVIEIYSLNELARNKPVWRK